MSSLQTLSAGQLHIEPPTGKFATPTPTPTPTPSIVQLLASKSPTRLRVMLLPDLAKFLLETTNLVNTRKLSEDHVYKIALDILEGRWQYNGDAISFSTDGKLLNGQHRLKACVESKHAIDVEVIFGLEPETVVTFDINRVRTAGVIGHTMGIENAGAACAIASLLLIHENGGIQCMTNPNRQPSKTAILERVQLDKRTQVIAGRCGAWGRGMVHPRIVGFCYYLFGAQQPELADKFFEEFRSGANISEGNPVFLLRKRLITNRVSKAKIQPLEIVALFFKAWNAYRKGQTVQDIRWRSRGDAPERFPKI